MRMTHTAITDITWGPQILKYDMVKVNIHYIYKYKHTYETKKGKLKR